MLYIDIFDEVKNYIDKRFQKCRILQLLITPFFLKLKDEIVSHWKHKDV